MKWLIAMAQNKFTSFPHHQLSGIWTIEVLSNYQYTKTTPVFQYLIGVYYTCVPFLSRQCAVRHSAHHRQHQAPQPSHHHSPRMRTRCEISALHWVCRKCYTYFVGRAHETLHHIRTQTHACACTHAGPHTQTAILTRPGQDAARLSLSSLSSCRAAIL